MSLRSGHIPCHGFNLNKENMGQAGYLVHVQDIDHQVVYEAEVGIGSRGALEHLQSDGC
jgi:hypothetical protein